MADARRNWDVLAGHVSAEKYGARFSINRIVTFVRRPKFQIISHWQHRVRHHGYSGTLSQFVESGAGILERYLGMVPVQLIGFVGVTEQYDESLSIFRQEYGINIDSRYENAKPTEPDGGHLTINIASLSSRARSRLRRDVLTYRQARRVLKERMRMMEARELWIHGAIVSMSRNRLRGVAYSAVARREGIQIQVFVNGKTQGTCYVGDVEGQFTTELLGHKFDKETFTFVFTSELKRNDLVELRVFDTAQWLDSQVWSPRDIRGFLPPLQEK